MSQQPGKQITTQMGLSTRQSFWRVPRVMLALASAITLLLNVPLRAAAPPQPNIVIILADDQGWGDLSVNGNTNLQTPNIDTLAADGVLLSHFYVCPVCSPTRAELLTGRYHPRGGVYSTSSGGERLDLDEKTIGDAFRAAGYATAAYGKWHNGTQYPYHPNARGFDDFHGFCSGHWGNYFDPVLEHNGQLVRGHGYITNDLTNHALDFIQKNKDRRFFCYLPLNVPHAPMQVPDEFYKKFDGFDPKMRNRDPEKEDIAMTRAALAMSENIDWNVGRILKQLDALQLADNTIVIYFSDNGPNSWRWNGDMKGRKGSTDEGGVRSPCMIRWPGHIRPGTKIPQICAAVDLLPTLADVAGVALPSSHPLDGRSIKPLLLGITTSWPQRMIFSHWRGRVSVRTQQYRLDDRGRLFDMQLDPGQRHNIASEHPQLAKQLQSSVAKWKQELLPGLTDDDRPFPVGYRQFPTTLLPARDGIPHGNVQRSAKFPNCSFFTNWKSADDSMTWDIEVATPGDYDAIIYYTCKPTDVGATIELGFHDNHLAGKVTEAHDPPLRGMEHDRVQPRGESYIKDFKPLKLGTMPLTKGRGELTLRALDIPGNQVIDVRYVVLVLKTE